MSTDTKTMQLMKFYVNLSYLYYISILFHVFQHFFIFNRCFLRFSGLFIWKKPALKTIRIQYESWKF